MLVQVVDLGTLKFGKPFKFNLLVKNEGTASVDISKISVGCTSCTKAKMAKTTIGPTEEQVIEVEFTPGTPGKQRKSVTLTYDNKTFRMEFTADVEN